MEEINKKFEFDKKALLLLFVIFFGFALRCLTFYFNPFINPDGVLYVNQAKAIYFKKYNLITSCYSYLSPCPLLIAFFYLFIPNWVIAAKSVSLFFATLSFIPLYFLLKEFLNTNETYLTMLTWACMPHFVYHSQQVIRDPIFWFFSILGLFLFAKYFRIKKVSLLLLSSICFLIGSWARIEGILYIAVSCIFLFIISIKDHNWRAFFFFLVPIIFILLVGIVLAKFQHKDISKLVPYGRILNRVNYTVKRYNELRNVLKKFDSIETGGKFRFFFKDARYLLWWIAIGTVIRNLFRAIFLPFGILIFWGIFKSSHLIKQNKIFLYFLSLSIGAILILYAQALYNWAVSTRYIALFLFPSFVFLGLGIRELIKKLSFKYSTALIACLIVFLPMKKLVINMTEKNRDYFTYKEIGRYIAKNEGYKRKIKVAGTFKRINIVHFYANENYPGVVCFDRKFFISNKISADFILKLGCDYFIWDEKHSYKISLQEILKNSPKKFIELNRWKTKKLGEMILYYIKL